jgi:hypothetical protein
MEINLLYELYGYLLNNIGLGVVKSNFFGITATNITF